MGDTLTINGTEVPAFIDYREEARDFGGIGAVQQDMLVLVARSDWSARPSPLDRITLPKTGTRIWQPISVGLDESGDYWSFGLKEVRS